MEKIPTFENEENLEQKLVRLLKEKGVEDPEARGLLDCWTREGEQEVERENSSVSSIQFNLRRARLYFEAGYTEEAFENFEAARVQAWNENRKELYEEIMREMDEKEGYVYEKK